MYCRICGTEQSSAANYCVHDGAMADSLSKQVVLQKEDSTYCRSCGEQNAVSALYCGKCGSSLLKVERTTKVIEPQQTVVAAPMQQSTLKNGVLGGAVVILCMLLAGWIGSFMLESALKEELKRTLGYADLLFYTDSFIHFFTGTAQTILNYHLLGISLRDVAGEYGVISWHTPFFLLVCIPFLIIGGTGLWIQKNSQITSMRERWITACLMGLIYGLFLLIVSFLGNYTFAIERNMMEFSYSHGASFVCGFTYGTLFSFIGMVVYAGRSNMSNYADRSMPFGAPIYYGVTGAMKGLLVTVVLLCIIALFSKPTFFGPAKDYKTGQKLLVSMQVAPQIWGMAHLAPVEIESSLLDKQLKSEYGMQSGTIRISYPTGITVNGTSLKELAIADGANLRDVKVMDDMNKELRWGLLFMIIPFFFMFQAGRKLAGNPSKNVYITLAVLSGAYAVMMTVINILANMNINIDIIGKMSDFFAVNGTLISIQNHNGYLLIFSFIMAYAASFVGVKVEGK